MIPVKVKEIVLDEENNPLLLLVDLEESNVLVIGIGFWEAQSILMKIQGNVLPRPMTHDLMNSLFRNLGAMLDKVVITDIIEDTYYAEMYLHQNGKEKVVDARPSDAVAMALTSGTTIYITEKIFGQTISIEEMAEDGNIYNFDDSSDEEGPQIH